MEKEQPCVHCGEDCGKYPVLLEEQPFCCEGCKTVYQILNTNQLGKYYEIEKMPGVKVSSEQSPRIEKYAFLDLEEIREKLLDFSDGSISKIRFFIPSIHCASCIWLLENLNTLNPGIIQSVVDFPKKEVAITFRDSEVSLRELVELLVSIHYIPEISQKSKDAEKAGSANKTLLIKIGIAGFSFLNAMLYHFPQYLPGSENLENDFRLVFGWLSLALSLPVLFYCANDYFITAYKSLRKKVISIDLPIALGLITLFVQSTWDVISGSGIGYFDSLTGLVFFLLVGKWYQGKTYQALSFERDYKTYFPVAVTRIKNNIEETISLERLQPQDVMLVRNQEIIPADSILTKGEANIDYSFVTGESMPVRKNNGDFIFAGGKQVGEAIELQVQKEVEQSYLTQLWNQNNTKNPDARQLKNTINKVSQYFTFTIILIALGAGAYWWMNDPGKAVFAFSSVLIIACPCALALTIPFTFGSTMRQFGRRGFYLKNSDVIEQLQKISTIVFDKTGTLTYSRSANVKFNGNKLTDEEKAVVKSAAFQSTHPMSKIISEHFEWAEKIEVDDFKEIPGMGVSAVVNGCKIMLGSRFFVTGKTTAPQEQNTQVWLAINNQVKGFFSIENSYRNGLTELIQDLKNWYRLHLISGDNDAERNNLKSIFPKNSQLNFNQLPDEKLKYVEQLQQNGETVLMIGDGLNDAGALNKSDVGIVIADDIYNFSPACDAILQASNFEKLNHFVRFTKKSMGVVKISFAISFLYNLTGMFFAVQGILSPIVAAILMPLSSVTVVVFSTFAVSFLAKRSKL